MEEQQTTTDLQVDNSSEPTIEERVAKVLNDEPAEESEEPKEEPEEQEEAPKEEQDNTPDECPDKFKDKDGKVDVNKLAKSYKELEPLLAEKSNWTKERAELLEYKKIIEQQREENERRAQEQGYASASEKQMSDALINLEANEYAKYLHTTEDPEEVRKMLIAYISNPSAEALDDIELEFPSEVIKKVAVAKERQRAQWESELSKQQETQALVGIENVISQAVDFDRDIFNHKPFEDLFVKTLQRYGNNFTFEDAQVLIGAVNDLRNSIREEVAKEYGINKENGKATDELASITSSNSAPVARQSIKDLSGDALASAIKRLI